MSIPEMIFWILAFATATAIVYGWGLAKSRSQQRDLLALLYVKGEKSIKKALRKNGPMEQRELEKLLTGTTASLFYSKNRAVVKDPASFTQQLLDAMTEKGVLTKDGNRYCLKRNENPLA